MVGVAFICCTFVAKIKYHIINNIVSALQQLRVLYCRNFSGSKKPSGFNVS